MYIIDRKLTKEFINGLSNKRRAASFALEFPNRLIQDSNDVLLACKNVYDSGIIFPQGGASAKREGTPNIDNILSALADKIYHYFSNTDNAEISKEKFDEEHDNWCRSFLDSLNVARISKGYVKLEYGSAQKMVNMILKYLACYNDYAFFARHFKWAHMPVDTVILKWLKDNYCIAEIEYYVHVDEEGKETLSARYENVAWTKFDQSLYLKLVRIIREKISDDTKFKDQTLLGVEFGIWE